MPSHVKAFWRLSIALVAYWTISRAGVLIFPSGSHLVLAARVAQQHPDFSRLIDISNVVELAVWCGATLGTAWLATFRRMNWARWVAAALLLYETIPIISLFVLFSFDHRPDAFIAQAFWSHPMNYAIPTFSLGASIAAIVSVFSGNARGWFKPSGDIQWQVT